MPISDIIKFLKTELQQYHSCQAEWHQDALSATPTCKSSNEGLPDKHHQEGHLVEDKTYPSCMKESGILSASRVSSVFDQGGEFDNVSIGKWC